MLRATWRLALFLPVVWLFAGRSAAEPDKPAKALAPQEQVREAQSTIQSLLVDLKFEIRARRKSVEFWQDRDKEFSDRETRKLISAILQRQKNTLEEFEKTKTAVQDLDKEFNEMNRQRTWNEKRVGKLMKRLDELATWVEKNQLPSVPLPMLRSPSLNLPDRDP
jgi:hypothetical protein